MPAVNYTPLQDGDDATAVTFNGPLQELDDAIQTLQGGLSCLAAGRLTLHATDPVPSADIVGATTLYLLPYRGNVLSLWNGSSWWPYQFSGVSFSMAGLLANTNYDIFVYDNGGTLALEAEAWASDAARATALALQNGVLCKTGALDRRFYGSIRTVAAGQCDASEARQFVDNYYNRVIKSSAIINNSAHPYATGAWRAFNNDAASSRVEFIRCHAEDDIWAGALGDTQGATGNTALGIGIDSTTSEVSRLSYARIAAGLSYSIGGTAKVGIGYHYACMIEYGYTGGYFLRGIFNVQMTR